jgi:hypothetical protein
MAAAARPPPALDVALGADDAASAAVPRLAERIAATWAAARASLAAAPADGSQAALAAQQLAFLARYRLVAPPPDAAQAECLVAALPALLDAADAALPSSAHASAVPAALVAAEAALLLLARWAACAAGPVSAALLQRALPPALAHGGAAAAPRALFLASAAASPACCDALDAHDAAWRAALDALEQRRLDIRCAAAHGALHARRCALPLH